MLPAHWCRGEIRRGCLKLALTPALSRKRKKGKSARIARVHAASAFAWLGSVSAAGTAALCVSRAPLGRGEQAQELPRAPHAGARRKRARPITAQDVPQSDPGACSRSHAGMDARVTATARVCFLWLLSFAQAKESDSPARMAGETHRDVSRFSRKPKRSKNKIKSKTGFRPSPE